MAIDVNNIVQFYTGTALPADAAEHSNRVYFIKSGEVGSLYKGNELIAQTNNDATIQAIQDSINNLNTELDDHVKLYKALVNTVTANGTAITNNANAIAGIKNGATINDFAAVEATLNNYATKTEAKGYADAKDAAIKAAKDAADAAQANVDALEAKVGTVAEGKTVVGLIGEAKSAANAAQSDVDALETYVGTIPEGANVDSVIAYVDKKTTGIASDSALKALDQRVTRAETDIDAVEGKLAGIDSTVVEKINAAVEVEKNRAIGVENSLDGRLDTIEADYLKTADKTELTKAIADAKTEAIETVLGEAVPKDFDTLKEVAEWIQSDTTASAQLVTRVTNIENDYLKTADKTELAGNITKAQSAADKAQGEVDALEGIVSDLSGVVDTKAAKTDLTALAGRVTTAEGEIDTLQTDVDAVEEKAAANETAINKANTEIAKKASQADLTALTERVTTAEGEIDTLQSDLNTAKTGIKDRLTAVETKANNNASDISELLAALQWHQVQA